MAKKSDLQSVKNMALAFLHMEVEETEMSPIVVMHPVFESAFVTAKVNGEFRMLNILESNENFLLALERWEENIVKADRVFSVYAFIRKSYRLTFLKHIKDYLSEKDFSELLADAWVSSENPNQDINVPITLAIKWFRKANKKHLMCKEDYEYYQSLPQTITIYRGVAEGRNPQGLSWTCNKKTAVWFSKRFEQFGQKGYVQKAVVDKSLVLAYFNTRDEDEVVIDTSLITDIKRV